MGKRGSSDFGKKQRLADEVEELRRTREVVAQEEGPRFISLHCEGPSVKLVSSQARQVPGTNK